MPRMQYRDWMNQILSRVRNNEARTYDVNRAPFLLENSYELYIFVITIVRLC